VSGVCTYLLTSDRDLLVRHVRLSHPQVPQTEAGAEGEAEAEAEAEAAPEIIGCGSDDFGINDFDLFWDRAFLPPTEALFGAEPVISGESETVTVSQSQLQLHPQLPSQLQQSRPEVQATQKTTSFSQFSSGLPSLDLVDDGVGDNDEDNSGVVVIGGQAASQTEEAPWCISEPVFENLCEEIQSYATVFPPECSVPTNNTLSRGLEMYMRCTHKYLPFIHVPTFSVSKRPVELSLAMAALGLLYRVEHNKAYRLYFMARAIWSEKNRREKLRVASNILCGLDHTSAEDGQEKLQKIQALILLVKFASWGNKKIRTEAVSMAGELASKLYSQNRSPSRYLWVIQVKFQVSLSGPNSITFDCYYWIASLLTLGFSSVGQRVWHFGIFV